MALDSRGGGCLVVQHASQNGSLSTGEGLVETTCNYGSDQEGGRFNGKTKMHALPRSPSTSLPDSGHNCATTPPEGATRQSLEAICAALEREHVHNVYHQMSHHFQDVRFKAWPKVKQFLKDLEPGALVADIGCGNGKYLNINKQILKLGSDQCLPLVEIARGHNHEAMVADNLRLPYRDNCFDAVISIAVIHHFTTARRRAQAIQELSRILRPGGRLMIYVWAMEQKHRKFKSQDVLVPWHFKAKHPKREKSKPAEKQADSPKPKPHTPEGPAEPPAAKSVKPKKGKPNPNPACEASLNGSQDGHKKGTSIPHIIKSHLLRLIGGKPSKEPASGVDRSPVEEQNGHQGDLAELLKRQGSLYDTQRPQLEHSLSASEIEGFAVREFPMSSRPPVPKRTSYLSRSCDQGSGDHKSCDSLAGAMPTSQCELQCSHHNQNAKHSKNGHDNCIDVDSLKRTAHPCQCNQSVTNLPAKGRSCQYDLHRTQYSSSPNNNNSDEETPVKPSGPVLGLPPRPCLGPSHRASLALQSPETVSCPTTPVLGLSGKARRPTSLGPQPPRRPSLGPGQGSILSDSETDEDWKRNTRKAIQLIQDQVDSLGQPLHTTQRHTTPRCCSFHVRCPQVLPPGVISKNYSYIRGELCKAKEKSDQQVKDTNKGHSQKLKDIIKVTDIYRASEPKVSEGKVVANGCGKAGLRHRKRLCSDTSSISSMSSVSSLSSLSSDTDNSDVEEITSVCSMCANISSNLGADTDSSTTHMAGEVFDVMEQAVTNNHDSNNESGLGPTTYEDMGAAAPKQSDIIADLKENSMELSELVTNNSGCHQHRLSGNKVTTGDQSVSEADMLPPVGLSPVSSQTPGVPPSIPLKGAGQAENPGLVRDTTSPARDQTDRDLGDTEDRDSSKRYYHVFKEEELADLITKHVESLNILDSYYDHANWCVVCEKVSVWTL